jgi:tape measure domain-containing protein
MASIDERVVAMSFENARFEANVATSLSSLGKLDTAIGNIGKVNGLASLEASSNKVTLQGPMSALDKLRQKLGMTNAGTTFTDIEKASDKVSMTEPMTALDKLQQKLGGVSAGTTFTDMEKSADSVSFSGMYSAIDGIGSHLSAIQTAASVAMGNIAAVVAQKAGAIAKSFTIDPAVAGFHDYETQINAVQTILANTGLKGKKGMDQVNSALKDLQKYANLTVYNFADMAKNIGTFTAAGVKLGPATQSIKGIANLAALSGSNSQQASSAMYQLSQAIASGKVGLQDWNSVVNAGIGGSVFQKSLIRTGEAMGTIAKGAVDIDKKTGQATINGQNFRTSIQAKPGEKTWLTSDVLVKTLGQFTGDLSTAQLAAEGFNKAQIKAIEAQGRTAVNAATQVKTFSQLTQSLKEEVGTAWGNIFKTIFGNIGQATKLFSGLHNFLETALTKPLNDFNVVLTDFSKRGGRTELLAGLKSGFTDLSHIIKPIKDAFRDIFPATTTHDLLSMTDNFKKLMDRLRPAPETMEHLRKTFDGVFAVLHIGWTIVKDVFEIFGKLLGAASGVGGGFLGITANIGDFLTKLDKIVSKGNILETLFDDLKKVLKDPLKFIKEIGQALKDLFSGKDIGDVSSGISKSVGGLTTALDPLSGIVSGAQGAWQGFLGILGKLKKALSPLLDNIADVIGHFGDMVADDIKHANYDKVFSAIQTGLIAGIFLAIKKALGGGINIDFGGGLLKNLSGTFEALTGKLEAMQKNIQAHTLLTIAFAIGVLAAAVALLSTIDPAKLSKALTAVAVGMGELVAAMAILSKIKSGTGGLITTAVGLIALSTALFILAGAMKIFATMSWEEIGKGLVGVAGGLTAVAVGTKAMSSVKLVATGLALIPLAIGLNILAVAMKIFATMSWEQMGKGLVGVAGGLTAIALAMKLMPTTLPILGAGLILVSAGLVILAGAVSAFGHMSIATLAKGILAIGGALVIIGAAMSYFPPDLPLTAAGLVLVSGALVVLAGAISLMGHMSLETLGKGLVTIGLALGILALGLYAMEGALPGAAALTLAAVGIDLLVPALAAIGSLPWSVILKGLGAMALTLGVLAAVGIIVAVPLTALGVAILALGIGLAAVGGAVYLFAKGISLLSDTSVKAMAAIIAAISLFISALPGMIIKLFKGFLDILSTVVQIAPKIVKGLVSIAGDLLDGIIKLAPKIASAIGALISAILKVISDNAGPILDAGAKLFLTLLTGIANNIGKIVDTVTRIITTFLGELAKKAPKIVTAGVNLLVSFLNGLAKNIGKIVTAGANLIVSFLKGIAKNVKKILDAGGDIIVNIITGIGKNLWRIVNAGGNAIAHFITGVGDSAKKIIKAGTDAAGKFITALAKGIVDLADKIATAVITLLNGIAGVIRKRSKQLGDAGANITEALVSGMIKGIGTYWGDLTSWLWKKIKSLPGIILDFFGIGSPSKLMMEIGGHIGEGFLIGIQKGFDPVDKAMEASARKTVKSAKASFGKVPDAISGVMGDLNPVITPVLDLSHVQANAKKLNDILPSSVITAKISTDQAAKISADQQAPVTDTTQPAPAAATNVTFNQTNNSPDPLPAIEIYRQTKNQLSQVKSLVGA